MTLKQSSHFLRRIGRQYDISPVLVGEVTVYDYICATSEMASRFELFPIPRWSYDEAYLSLLDSLEAPCPSHAARICSAERKARHILGLSEGLIGEIVAILTKAAIAAIQEGDERITRSSIDNLRYIPLSKRRHGPFVRRFFEPAWAVTDGGHSAGALRDVCV